MIHLIPLLIQALLPTLIRLGVYAVIYIAYLTFVEVIRWFNSFSGLLSNKQYSAVSIKQTLENGKKAIVQGVLNLAKKELVEGRTILYDQLDDVLTQKHDQADVVIYT